MQNTYLKFKKVLKMLEQTMTYTLKKIVEKTKKEERL